jgi:O-antigen/teichoic acid export membrane protein
VNTYLAASMVLISLVGNLILVPRYGISGAAAVRLITELSGLAGGGLYIAARITARGEAG